MLGVQAESHQSDVGSLSRGYRPDFLHVDLACDHLVPEPCDDLGEQLESLPPLIRDQDTQVRDLVHSHRNNRNLARSKASGVKAR